MKRRIGTALGVVLYLLVVGVPSALATTGLGESKPETIVSFTFDGGYKEQMQAAEILEQHNMAGTFYVNTGYIDYPAYLTLEQLRQLARGRHEIGAGSVHNLDLAKVESPKATREVCNDRATLDALGFQVTSFAYPYGNETQRIRSIVQKCGFNSARDVSGLRVSPTECTSCPLAEDMPPSDFWHIRSDASSVDVAFLSDKVRKVENHGGGYVPLIFRDICVCPKKGDDAITPTDFARFVNWIAAQPSSTKVRTVDQVIGGEYRPVRGTPLERLVPTKDTLGTGDVALSRVPAWTIGGVAIGQSQVLATFIIVGIAVVIVFRYATKSVRYNKLHAGEVEALKAEPCATHAFRGYPCIEFGPHKIHRNVNNDTWTTV